jgi:hypothetical protein
MTFRTRPLPGRSECGVPTAAGVFLRVLGVVARLRADLDPERRVRVAACVVVLKFLAASCVEEPSMKGKSSGR